ncbi:peptidoglycan/LPS O-acetylase OafA/YrhL [Sinobacterium caligoides]|uniref:Peptidoglycan/LPS O-acetylase OafA/YrhL n=1 Tax=Sinobacterium caligoides TaxID=933926 RepID=A0A3N2DGA3_9GAMM|nr:acyltransferase family protein [Sinobacterium caligoides]ROR98688.1 peptidoglycan/LPS O-acetylase OafA/YrhL [Sinobacterium caligoides]
MLKLQHRDDIDGLRALAILPIVLFHAQFTLFSGGFIGVDIFFVISGFLITSIIVRETAANNFSYKTFWARRARRILPASIIMIFACLVAGWYLLAPDAYRELGRSAREQAYFAANFFFAKEYGYFDNVDEIRPLLHTWSLSTEEQFYLLLPFVLVLLSKFSEQRRRLALIALCAASFFASVMLINNHPTSTFYLLHTRAWELLIGSLLAIAPLSNNLQRRPVLCEVISLSGFATIIFCIFYYDEQMVFPGAAALPPTVATAAIIWANSYHQTLIKRILSLPSLVWFGLISYSLYLWHWPIMAFTQEISEGAISTSNKFVLLAVSTVVGYLSWRFIETPFRQKRLLQSDKAILWASFCALIVIIIIGQMIRHNDGYRTRLSGAAFTFAEDAVWSKDQVRCYKLSPKDIDEGGICHFGGSMKTPAKLLFWGDSHSAALLPAVIAKANEYDIKVLHASNNGCIPIPGADKFGSDDGCPMFNQAMLRQATSSGVTDVLIASRWSVYVYGDSADDHSTQLATNPEQKNLEESKELFKENAENFIALLRQYNIRVWLVKQVPRISHDNVTNELIKRAMRGRDTSIYSITTDQHERRQRFASGVLEELAGDSVRLLDPTPFICDGHRCAAVDNGHSKYRDGNHLSIYGATSIQNMFDPLFQSIKERAATPEQ